MSTINYDLLLKQVEALISDERNTVANAANIASLLFNSLENVNWVGFYYQSGNELVLGPFNGQPACTRIPVGQGVCGTAFADKSPQLVHDVHKFEGHIACDAASESEVVVPFYSENLSGVLDVDSPLKNRFTELEQQLFESVVECYSRSFS